MRAARPTASRRWPKCCTIRLGSSKASSIPCMPTPTTSGLPTCRTRIGAVAAPQLKGRLDGIAARVPVPDGSVVDLFVELEKAVSPKEIHEAIKSAAESKRMKGILQMMETPVVSSDVIGNSHSSIFDPAFTSVTESKYLKCLSWYDNEWGYSNRVCDLLGLLAQWG